MQQDPRAKPGWRERQKPEGQAEAGTGATEMGASEHADGNRWGVRIGHGQRIDRGTCVV